MLAAIITANRNRYQRLMILAYSKEGKNINGNAKIALHFNPESFCMT
jgi:hypothetical protein